MKPATRLKATLWEAAPAAEVFRAQGRAPTASPGSGTALALNSPVRPIQAYPVQSLPMFAARLFTLNLAVTTLVAAGARAISTKTTTIKG